MDAHLTRGAVLRRPGGSPLRDQGHQAVYQESVSDIKQENKQQEGDPLLKQAILSKQMSMSRNRMMSDVAKADVAWSTRSMLRSR